MSSNQFLFRNQFEGVIWGTIISSDGQSVIVDVRNLQSQEIRYFKLSLTSLVLSQLEIDGSNWWSKMESFDYELVTSEYLDRNDPNAKKCFKWEKDGPTEVEITIIPRTESNAIHPSIYEVGTPYHQTVSEFLSLEIPTSCEYLEINKKIILSYYLRSNNQLDRHLLILDEGMKVMKEVQDIQMNGFAPGAFFVLDNKLFFVRNRNEICIYPL